ncbi:MAG: biotin transporter BioY [Nitriliruptorales bacterium]|nr:biotin transporter BioY [Nitriliruptorales bacterium]
MSAAYPRPVLADLLPRTAVRDVSLVVGAALLTAVCAQIAIPLEPFSPVPITAQTFAVLLTGAALGPLRGALGQGLYVGMGMFLPFYSEGGSGLAHLVGPTGGYLIGFVVAGWLIGALARRGQDRRVHRALLAFGLGHLVIFTFGVSWLAVVANLDLRGALLAGLVPFIPGMILKTALAAGLLPAAWKLAGGDGAQPRSEG